MMEKILKANLCSMLDVYIHADGAIRFWPLKPTKQVVKVLADIQKCWKWHLSSIFVIGNTN